MGLVQWFTERRRLSRERKEHDQFERQLADWEHEQAELNKELQDATEPTGFTSASGAIPVILHKNESVFLVASGAALVEPKRLPGNWVGNYSGVSFRIMKGVSYRVGESHGHYIPGPEVPAPIAIGTVTVTDQRVVFQSDRQAREWTFSKLLGYQHDPSKPLTYFQVSNRQTVSGIGYDAETTRKWRFRLSLALAHYRTEVPALLEHIKKEIQDHDVAKPHAPLPRLASAT